MELGEEIKKLRLQSQWSSRMAFSKEVNMSREALRKIENGGSVPSRKNLNKILDIVSAPATHKHNLLKMRDEMQASKEGTEEVISRPDDRAIKLSRDVVASISEFLDSRFNSKGGSILDNKDRKDLLDIVVPLVLERI